MDITTAAILDLKKQLSTVVNTWITVHNYNEEKLFCPVHIDLLKQGQVDLLAESTIPVKPKVVKKPLTKNNANLNKRLKSLNKRIKAKEDRMKRIIKKIDKKNKRK